MKKYTLILSILMFCFGKANTHPKSNNKSTNPNRIEFEKEDNSYKYSAPCSNKEFLMHGPDKENGSKVWKFHKFSTELKEIESFSFKIGNKMEYNSYVINKDKTHLYILLHSQKKNSLIVDYKIITGVALEHKITKTANEITNFCVVNNIAYFQSLKTIHSFNLINDEKEAKIIFSNNGLYSMDKLGNEEGISISYYESKNRNKIHVIILDKNGEASKPFVANLDKGHDASSAIVSKLPNGSFLISGGYFTENKTVFPEGIYVLKVNDKNNEYLSFSFNELFGTKKIPKTGKDEIQTRGVLMHQIKVIGNEALLVAEFYEESNSFNSSVSYNSYTGASSSNQTVFDGYKFENGLVLKFDAKGQFISKSTISMYQKIHKSLQIAKQFSWIDSDNHFRLIMSHNFGVGVFDFYSERGSFDGGFYKMVDSDLEYTDIYVSYWDDNFVLASGFKKIKRSEKRKAYFISRVRIKNSIEKKE